MKLSIETTCLYEKRQGKILQAYLTQLSVKFCKCTRKSVASLACSKIKHELISDSSTPRYKRRSVNFGSKKIGDDTMCFLSTLHNLFFNTRFVYLLKDLNSSVHF